MTHHHNRRHGSTVLAMTPVPVELHQRHLILQIIEFNSQTGSVLLRVMERAGRVLYIYKESISFDDLVTIGINRGHVSRYMFYDGRELHSLLNYYSFFKVNKECVSMGRVSTIRQPSSSQTETWERLQVTGRGFQNFFLGLFPSDSWWRYCSTFSTGIIYAATSREVSWVT